MARPLNRLLHWRRLSCQARHHAAAELFCHCFGSRRNALRPDGGSNNRRAARCVGSAASEAFIGRSPECQRGHLPTCNRTMSGPSRCLHILPLQGTWETRPRFIFGQLLGRCFVLGKDFIEGTALRTLAQFGVPFEVSGEPKILLVYPRLPRITAKVAHQNPRIEICSPAGPSWNRKLPPGTGRPPGVTNSRTGFIR